jgi:hypothetical protein
MARRTSKQKSKISRRFAIAGAVLGLLGYISKEIVTENVKSLHESIERAEARYENESNQFTLSIQALNLQQQIEALKLQADSNRGDLKRDFSGLILQVTAEAHQVVSQVDVEFESVSRLLEKLPSSKVELRRMLQEVKNHVEERKKQTEERLKPTGKNDGYRFIEIKVVEIQEMLEGILVAIASDSVLTEAHRVEVLYESYTKWCALITYLLFISALILGLYAAFCGFKPESAE